MNKKQRNRKDTKQNKRNRSINRRYSSTIKTFSKLFLQKKKKLENENSEELLKNLKNEMLQLVNSFYQILDKAVKKNVIHKNKAARKKSTIGKFASKL